MAAAKHADREDLARLVRRLRAAERTAKEMGIQLLSPRTRKAKPKKPGQPHPRKKKAPRHKAAKTVKRHKPASKNPRAKTIISFQQARKPEKPPVIIRTAPQRPMKPAPRKAAAKIIPSQANLPAPGANGSGSADAGGLLKTPIDDLLRLLIKHGEIRITDAAIHFRVNEEKIENWGRILEEHSLAELHYPAFGKPSLRAAGYRPKKRTRKGLP